MTTTLEVTTNATAEQIAEAKAAKKLAKVRENASKHAHAIIETLSYHPDFNKYACFIRCTKCGSEDREVFTSDLHQVNLCDECAKEAKKAAKAAQRAEVKAAKALLKKGGAIEA